MLGKTTCCVHWGILNLDSCPLYIHTYIYIYRTTPLEGGLLFRSLALYNKVGYLTIGFPLGGKAINEVATIIDHVAARLPDRRFHLLPSRVHRHHVNLHRRENHLRQSRPLL